MGFYIHFIGMPSIGKLAKSGAKYYKETNLITGEEEEYIKITDYGKEGKIYLKPGEYDAFDTLTSVKPACIENDDFILQFLFEKWGILWFSDYQDQEIYHLGSHVLVKDLHAFQTYLCLKEMLHCYPDNLFMKLTWRENEAIFQDLKERYKDLPQITNPVFQEPEIKESLEELQKEKDKELPF